MNAPDITAYLSAMKASAIPEGWSKLWFVRKLNLIRDKPSIRQGTFVVCPCGLYTFLHCVTDSTMHLNPPGALVMEDTPFELRAHLGFVMRAYGRVLVTGLGLGCVVRGLLENPRIEHITCIEDSPDVLKLVLPYMPLTDRLTIIEAEALKWTAQNKVAFDCAWHDLWTNRDDGEPHLDIWHTQLFTNCRGMVKHQGAWGFHRAAKRLLIKHGFQWMG